MLLEKSEEDLGPVGGNLPDQPEQIVHDRIEPLTLPEPPSETEPAQVVLDQPPPADAAATGTTAPTPAVPQPESAGVPATAPPTGMAEEAVTAPQPEVPVPAVSTPTPAQGAAPTPAQTAAPVAAPAPVVTAPPVTTAPPAAKPAPVAPAKALSGWVVQLVATANKTKALALQEQLRTLGYTAFVEEIKTAQGVLFRVRVGPELERGNAENVRDRLEQQVQIKGMVTRYP
jgi:cell division septation protein DedD